MPGQHIIVPPLWGMAIRKYPSAIREPPKKDRKPVTEITVCHQSADEGCEVYQCDIGSGDISSQTDVHTASAVSNSVMKKRYKMPTIK